MKLRSGACPHASEPRTLWTRRRLFATLRVPILGGQPPSISRRRHIFSRCRGRRGVFCHEPSVVAMAMALLFLCATAAAAEPDAASPGPIGRLVEGTKDFFRDPLKRRPLSAPPASPDMPSVKESSSGVHQATYTTASPNPQTPTAAKQLPAAKQSSPAKSQSATRPASSPARTTRRAPRTLTEYMAEERP